MAMEIHKESTGRFLISRNIIAAAYEPMVMKKHKESTVKTI